MPHPGPAILERYLNISTEHKQVAVLSDGFLQKGKNSGQNCSPLLTENQAKVKGQNKKKHINKLIARLALMKLKCVTDFRPNQERERAQRNASCDSNTSSSSVAKLSDGFAVAT